MIDIKFIKFYIRILYDESLEDYFHVQKSTVSTWKKRGTPIKYIKMFSQREKSEDIYILFERLYPKTKK